MQLAVEYVNNRSVIIPTHALSLDIRDIQKDRFVQLPPFTNSYVTLEKTRQLLRDHFERNDTAPIIALIGTADESAWKSSLT